MVSRIEQAFRQFQVWTGLRGRGGVAHDIACRSRWPLICESLQNVMTERYTGLFAGGPRLRLARNR